MGIVDRASPLGIELNAAKERIQMLENELQIAGRSYTAEVRSLESRNTKNESELRKKEDMLEGYKFQNRELLERIVHLEKFVDVVKLRENDPNELAKSINKGQSSKPFGSSGHSQAGETDPKIKDMEVQALKKEAEFYKVFPMSLLKTLTL